MIDAERAKETCRKCRHRGRKDLINKAGNK